MHSSAPQPPARAADVTEAAVQTVREWRAAAEPPSPRSLSPVLADPSGQQFVMEILDRVVRPDDVRFAGRELERLSRDVPPVVPSWLRILIQLLGGFALLLPRPIIGLVRSLFWRRVDGLVIDSDPNALSKRVEKLDARLTFAPLSFSAGGPAGAADVDGRVQQMIEFMQRDDVESVSVPLTSLVGRPYLWAFEEGVQRAVDHVLPLFAAAAASRPSKRITLEAGESGDHEFVREVFTRILDLPELQKLEAGITVQAYLPSAFDDLRYLTEWARYRRAAGGAGIRIRIVKGGFLEQELADASIAGRPPAIVGSRAETEANFMLMLHWLLSPERGDSVRASVATDNLFTLAYAKHLAEARAVSDRVEFETHLAAVPDAVRADLGNTVLWAPVASRQELAAVSTHLMSRLSGAASAAGAADDAAFEREAERLRAAVRDAAAGVSRETEDVTDALTSLSAADPSEPAARERAREILGRARASVIGNDLVADSVVADTGALNAVIAASVTAAETWALSTLHERAAALDDFSLVLSALRARLTEVLVSEAQLPFAEADAEVVRAIAFARAATSNVHQLGAVDHATLEPLGVVLAAPGPLSAVSDTVEHVCAALGAGNAVVVQPSHSARRAAALVVEAAHEAGIARDLVRIVVPQDGVVARATVEHPQIARVSFTGDPDTAALLRSWRPGEQVHGEGSGVSSAIVTPSADTDAAVADIVQGAFAHGGRHPLGTRLVILVGSLAESDSFRAKLAQAVRAVHAAPPTEVSARYGPLPGGLHERARRALTVLDGDEQWLVQPQPLDDRLTLWRAGVRDAVPADRALERVVAGPLIVLTTAADLDEAIALQSAGHGDAAALHSLEGDEIAAWLAQADAGFLAVNRATIGAPAHDLPSGGWRGVGGLKGTADRMLLLTDWVPEFAEPVQSVKLTGIGDRVRALVEAAQPAMNFLEFDRVRAGAVSDELAWKNHFGRGAPLSPGTAQRNVLRHVPASATIRLAEGSSVAQLVRVLAAATRAGGPVEVSTSQPLPERLSELIAHPFSPLTVRSVDVETDAQWMARVEAGEVVSSRIRLIGGEEAQLVTALEKQPDVGIFAHTASTSGRLELLPFLRAQTVSMNAHRHGIPDQVLGEIQM